MQVLSCYDSIAFPSPLSIRAQAHPFSPHPRTPSLLDTDLMRVQRVVQHPGGLGATGQLYHWSCPHFCDQNVPPFVLHWIIPNAYYFNYFLLFPI